MAPDFDSWGEALVSLGVCRASWTGGSPEWAAPCGGEETSCPGRLRGRLGVRTGFDRVRDGLPEGITHTVGMMPPSTRNLAPVSHFARGEARKAIISATSLGSPGRPIGTFRWSTICCLTSSSPVSWLSAIR